MKKKLQTVKSVLAGVLLVGAWVWSMSFIYLALQSIDNQRADMGILFKFLPYLLGGVILYGLLSWAVRILK